MLTKNLISWMYPVARNLARGAIIPWQGTPTINPETSPPLTEPLPLGSLKVEGVAKSFDLQSPLLARWFGSRAAEIADTDDEEDEEEDASQAEDEPRAQRRVLALDRIDLVIRPGERVGILGGNDAGKSTLLRILAGTMLPSKGTVRHTGTLVFLTELRGQIFATLTARQHLILFEKMMGLPEGCMTSRANEIAAFSGLADRLDSQVRLLNKTAFARFGFAAGLLCEPDILVIDEQMGVGDPLFRQQCLDRINKLLDGGATLVIASQKADLIESYCQRGIWLEEGRIVTDGPVERTIDAYWESIRSTMANSQLKGEVTKGDTVVANDAMPDRHEDRQKEAPQAPVTAITDFPRLPVGAGSPLSAWQTDVDLSAVESLSVNGSRRVKPVARRVNRFSEPTLGRIYALEGVDDDEREIEALLPDKALNVRVGVEVFEPDTEIAARFELHIDTQLVAVCDLPVPVAATEPGHYILGVRIDSCFFGSETRRINWKILVRTFLRRKGQDFEQMEVGALQFELLGDHLRQAATQVTARTSIDSALASPLPPWVGPMPGAQSSDEARRRRFREPYLRPQLNWKVERVGLALVPIRPTPETVGELAESASIDENAEAYSAGTEAPVVESASVDGSREDFSTGSEEPVMPTNNLPIQPRSTDDEKVEDQRRSHLVRFVEWLRDLWGMRGILLYLTTNSIRQAYSQAILGYGWLIIRPLVMTVTGCLLVGSVLNVGVTHVPLGLFTLCGVVPWLLFQRGAIWATKSLVRYRVLMKRFRFPRLILLLSSLGLAAVETSVGAVTAVLGMIYYGPLTGIFNVNVGLHTIWVIPALLWIALLVIALGCFTSIFNNFARDMIYTLSYLISFTSIATPVFYPRSAMPLPWRNLILLNPLTAPIELFRWSLLNIYPPDMFGIEFSLALTTVFLMAGLFFFYIWESKSLDSC